MKRMTFSLDEESIRKLKTIEKKTEINLSKIIRKAIAEYYDVRYYEYEIRGDTKNES